MGEERRKKKKKKKEDEQIKIFKFGFFTLVKGSRNFWSRYSISILKGSSLKLFELLSLVSLGVVPIPYV